TMLQKFIRKARGGRARFSRRIIQGVPAGITSVERLAVRNVVKGIGASRVYLVEEGLASAVGAKLPVAGMKASMIVDIGGGTTSIPAVAHARNFACQKPLTGAAPTGPPAHPPP